MIKPREIHNSTKYGMNLVEKIIHLQKSNKTPTISKINDIVSVNIDRTLASELTWIGMNETIQKIGNPSVYNKDKFFIAIDHTVDPRNYNNPEIKERIKLVEDFVKKENITDYYGPNESILHTEFYRQSAQPNTIIIGADSHSCSHGCIGAFSMGLGASDVVFPLITGKTWLQIPKVININLKGNLQPGMNGKDVILWILKKFGRNTIGLEKVIEFSGNISGLSIDDRFSICNMAVEFGAITGIFPVDKTTKQFLSKREDQVDYDNIEEIRPDFNAIYDNKYEINLDEIVPTVAKYPNPDDVYTIGDDKLYEPIYDENEKKICDTIKYLDGVFIGACTTSESELILAGLLLKSCMENFNMKPKLINEKTGKPYIRRVTPGSSAIVQNLYKLGLIDIYKRAGFIIGSPGCSYCLGVACDRAESGQIFLSSQNRNFRNRMGTGSIGNVASAATVALSSFNMEITDPSKYLQLLDKDDYKLLNSCKMKKTKIIKYESDELIDENVVSNKTHNNLLNDNLLNDSLPNNINGKIQMFNNNIDTDAIIPAQFMTERKELGKYAFYFARPKFYDNVQNGHNIIIAGSGFGSGSSREEAVLSLKLSGIQCVIAESFSFIFYRNLLIHNLLGIVIKDKSFYEKINSNSEININTEKEKIYVDQYSYDFNLSNMEKNIYNNGGIINMYQKYGRNYLDNL